MEKDGHLQCPEDLERKGRTISDLHGQLAQLSTRGSTLKGIPRIKSRRPKGPGSCQRLAKSKHNMRKGGRLNFISGVQ